MSGISETVAATVTGVVNALHVCDGKGDLDTLASLIAKISGKLRRRLEGEGFSHEEAVRVVVAAIGRK